MSESKTCSKCKQTKPIGDFFKNKRLKDGHNSYCKPCQVSYLRDYHKRNPDKDKNYKKTWRSKNPDYDRTYYLSNKERLNKLHAEWRVKNFARKAEMDRKYAIANRDKIRRYAAEYARNHPEQQSKQRHMRRARLRNARIYKVTERDIRRILLKDCVYCGKKGEQIDHVIPLSRGGNHSIGNLVSSCAKCNLTKNNKLVIEWKIYLKK